MRHNTEQAILENALQAMRCEAGLHIDIEKVDVELDGYQVDALLKIEGVKNPFAAEVKKWAQQANLGALINQIKNLPEQGILIADYVDPKMAEKLRQAEVQFIDAVGNAYINAPPAYVYVKGNQKNITNKGLHTKIGTNRAFEPTGLKVIFAFLCQPELVNAPYREIAEKAGVAVGTVGWVINGLKEVDLIRAKGNKQKRRITNYKKLLERWVEAYPERLRPKQWLGDFIADDPNWWKGVELQQYAGYWAGEIAATKYTNYLKPQVATVYLNDNNLNKFLGDHRLRKAIDLVGDKAAIVTLYRTFWPEDLVDEDIETNKELVDPILVYADLVATGDTRNIEVARRIYDEYITRHFGED
ncbi:hypothetical protein MNBD_GAMMA12-1787 [hydrothermal vent metagenome]|uniref:Uncharacterized protein n=1 Tax=hydrothermal vent metagenome TaxID=652676 RepID=A0A3B0Y8I6_9ZZZZ